MQEIRVLGFRILKGCLDRKVQEEMRDNIREVVRAVPLRRYETPGGRQMSVQMSAAGALGWVSDRGGYRYQPHHPDGQGWPPIPECISEVWNSYADCLRQPKCCLINFYDQQAKMGLHQDADEADFSCPVVSISLGDPATFRMGGPERGGKTQSILLESGDVVVMGGAARKAYHGIDRIHFGRSDLLAQGGRINLTLRVVT
ncbi:alpha-ketoglutarate-dependent dioxygenase AlkB [Halovulum sp. GXIMD14793]